MSAPAWMKLGLLGSTYARALQNKAIRTHGAANVDPATFAHIAAQPRARFDPDVSAYARQPGAYAPTAQTRAMANFARDMPWAGSEHTQNTDGVAQYNQLLNQRGMAHETPAGQTPVQTRINASFGTSRAAPNDTQIGHAPSWKPRVQGRNPLEHLDGMAANTTPPSVTANEATQAGRRRTPAALPQRPQVSQEATAVLAPTAAPHIPSQVLHPQAHAPSPGATRVLRPQAHAPTSVATSVLRKLGALLATS